jgi:hypothetical protein
MMSKFVQLKTQLRDSQMIKLALDDLNLQYSEDAKYTHRWSGYSEVVPLLVTDANITFGLRQAGDGSYEAVGDDMQMRRILPALDRITRRYAYQMVLAETSAAGFDLVEETVGQDDVIRLTVRRWR